MLCKKFFLSFTFILASAVLLGGCFIQVKTQPTARDGGIFKTGDRGETWVHKVAVPAIGGTAIDIATVTAAALVMDPQDNKAIYLGTTDRGMYYSYNGGESWLQTPQITSGKVSAIAIDPQSTCIIYATVGNNVYKSTDCNRHWQTMYIDPRAGTEISAIAIDPFTPRIVYIGNSLGEIQKSTDSGQSWKVVGRLASKILKIMMDPGDSDIIYVGVDKKGIFKSEDAGDKWRSQEAGLKDYPNSLDFHYLVFSGSEANALFYTSQYGLLKSLDGGESWESILLITAENQPPIYAAVIDPQNPNNLYYATTNTFVKSVDGGKNWITKKLVTARPIHHLLMDPLDPKIIYMGAGPVPAQNKKSAFSF